MHAFWAKLNFAVFVVVLFLFLFVSDSCLVVVIVAVCPHTSRAQTFNLI